MAAVSGVGRWHDLVLRAIMPEMLNGSLADLTPNDPIKAAQQKLAEAAMRQPMTPNGVMISAYVNGVVNAATLSALLEHVLGDDKGIGEFHADFAALLLKHLQAKTDLFENTAKEAPRIIAAQSLGHG